jgi:leader peptidase (prepilin peptidase)/N-methyltransferase
MAVQSLLTALALFAFGAVIGSFVTTLAMRIRAGRPWVADRSRCDGCGRVLGLVRTLPIVSFLALRGRCDACGSPISWLHPAGETAGGLILATAFAGGVRIAGLIGASLGYLALYTGVWVILARRRAGC